MESDEDSWMEEFHNRVQKEDGEKKELRNMVEQLAGKVEEAELVRRENERLKAENDRIDRERRQYQEEMEEFKEFVRNNLSESPGKRREADESYARQCQQSRNYHKSKGDKSVTGESSITYQREDTPFGFERATVSDPNVFFRKSSKGHGKERHKEKVADADTTESADSEEEGPTFSQKGKISTPWPLKRERRVKGEEMLQRRMEATRRKDVTPETFSGDVNLSEYLSQFEASAEWNGWSERQKTQQLFLSLRGRARGAIRQSDEWKTMTYKALVNRLEEMFCGQEEMYLAQLRGRYQQTQESIQDFSQAIRKLTDKAYAEMPEQSKNRIARDFFLEHLRDREVRSAVHLARPSTMEEAVRSALQTEAFLATERQRHPKSTRNVETCEQGEVGKMSEILSLLKHICEKQEEVSRKETRKSQQEQDQNESRPPPWTGFGRGSGRGRAMPSNRGRGRGRGCFKCGAFNHFIANCPMMQNTRMPVSGEDRQGNDNRPNLGARERSTAEWAPSHQERQ